MGTFSYSVLKKQLTLMFRFLQILISDLNKHIHVHSVESIITTRGHELGRALMTEEFKMFGMYIPM